LSPTYFPNVTLFDGSGVQSAAGVLVTNGTIAWVGSHGSAPREASSADVIDTEGQTLTPGLIDCHVHLCFDGDPDFVAEARVSEAFAAVKCVVNAERHVRAGVTAVRDLGSLGAVACDVAKAIDQGRVRGPRVIASGRALTITGGHGWNTFAREVDGAEAVRRAVREEIKAGARSIKLVATGGVLTPAISVDFASFSREEVAAAVDEAHRWGAPVAAHAIGEAGIENSVSGGIDSIEHGSQITDRIAEDMKARGTFHVPTINALRGIVDHPEDVPAYAVEKGRQIIGMAEEAFGRAVRAGVRHACGTDAGTPHNRHGGAPEELIRMVEWGLSPKGAMQAGTANAAALLRLPLVGRIEQRMAADLVLWEGNPVDDITAVRTPRVVMQRGEVLTG
jgi:imidazolonepropionase-like amidohydrolase